jgi:6-phosphogluconate dehydrogenase (decarboxylating)
MSNNNRKTYKLVGVIYDELADVAAAWQAMDVIWVLLLGYTQKAYVSMDDIDLLSDELRRVETGLRTSRHFIKWLLEEGVEDPAALLEELTS